MAKDLGFVLSDSGVQNDYWYEVVLGKPYDKLGPFAFSCNRLQKRSRERETEWEADQRTFKYIFVVHVKNVTRVRELESMKALTDNFRMLLEIAI